MFKTSSPSKNGNFIPLSMDPYKIPKLKDSEINFFPNTKSCSIVKKQSSSKLKSRDESVLAQLRQDRDRRISEIRRLEIQNESSVQVEKEIIKRAKLESEKVSF